MHDIEAQNAEPYEEETKLGSSRDRMWTLYMKQAGAFDRHMVEDWKGVMEGTLIFSGLFSAVVTTFMVESLRKLTADMPPGTPPRANPEDFISSSSYIAINTLWSLSLSSSMGCAISATLVQQWARSYLHAVDNQHQPPHKRALIRAYMFEGVGASHMTIAIEGIPILLHASLFLFLIGLIIYFYGINPLISYPIMAVFIVSFTMYLIPTCMPLARSNFPFHTPLSTPFWWFWRTVWHKDNWNSAKSMEIIREEDAAHTKRSERSYDAISWILRRSDEDREFEELLDAIAGYKGTRSSKYPSGRVLVANLVKEYPVEVLLRTYTMLESCGRFSKKLDNRATVILRAIPALAVSWHTVKWKNSKAVTSSSDANILSHWPLEMLKTIDKAVVRGGAGLIETDLQLVLSTYRVLLQVIVWAANSGAVVEASFLETEKLDFDHTMDNIKVAKKKEKLAFDVIVDTLVSGAFHKALSDVILGDKGDGTAPLYEVERIEPYLIMLDFLFKPDESARQRFFSCIREPKLLLGLSPDLRDRFKSTEDRSKMTKTTPKKLSDLSLTDKIAESIPQSRPPLNHNDTGKTLTNDDPDWMENPNYKDGTSGLKLREGHRNRNSASTASTTNDNN